MLLEIKDLKVSYGKIEAIKGISLNVSKGEIVTLVGANGAGKTTLLKTISGILKPSNGVINFEGKDIQSIAPHDRVLAGQFWKILKWVSIPVQNGRKSYKKI